MDALVERCAGLDVHQASVVCCILIGTPGCKPQKLLRRFGTTTRELKALRAWLAEHGVTHVGMESTGVYCLGSRGRRNTLTEGVAMRAGKRRSDRALRAVLPRSPGRPGV